MAGRKACAGRGSPCEVLAASIVHVAVKDWRTPSSISFSYVCGECERRRATENPEQCEDLYDCEWKYAMLKAELAEFFLSDLCESLIGAIDPDLMRKALGVDEWVRRTPCLNGGTPS